MWILYYRPNNPNQIVDDDDELEYIDMPQEWLMYVYYLT